MPFYYLPNLSASSVAPIEPWTVESHRPAFPSKDAFRLWCNDPTTDHAFITAVEGRQPGLRVSEVNPPNRMCGLVLDYDAIPPGLPELILLNNAPTDLRPAYVSRTFSGNCRVIFRFAVPIPTFSLDVGREFLKKCQRELKLRKLLPGFESEALMDLSKTYEIGDNWVPVGDGSAVIPENLLMAWIQEASRKHRWDKEGPVIGLDALRAQAQKKFPDKWPNGWDTFEPGARGPRFWDESATDPLAVIVRESGCQYFSDGGGFMSWEAIFGADFVRKWSDDRKGGAIAHLWHDGANYWRKLQGGEWSATNKSDIALDLFVSKRLSSKPARPGTPSEIDDAIFDIQNLKNVKAAMPFLYRPDGPYIYNGKRYLNTSSVAPIQPVVDHCEWGESLPWLAEFLSSLFDPDDQLDYFIAWVRHFYMGAVTQDPQRGLALFIAGPVGAGKTILNKAVLGQLMGGRQDAGAYLLGSDKFNDQLMGAALWNIDDEVLASDPKQRQVFSQMIKKVVANDSITLRAMYQSGMDMEWLGRPVITMNDDPESLQILPETEINILDKIMLLLTKMPDVTTWPTDVQVAAELPFFGAFLRDWVPPDHVIPPPGKRRFGVMPYKHPELMRAAGGISKTSSFEEVLQIWRKDWFRAGGPGEGDANWVGNPTQFLAALSLNIGLTSIVAKNFPSQTGIGIHLNKLIARGVTYLTTMGHRQYAIARPTP